MISWAKPGAKCVCIDADPRPGKVWLGDGPVKGGIYTVRSVWVDHLGDTVADFEELQRSVSSRQDHDWRKIGYRVDRFRPLINQQDDLELFRHLLSPSPLERLDLLAERLNELAED